jgi:hypothetical protein
MIKFTKSNLEKIERLLEEQLYEVRFEKGNFQSGYCLLEARKVVVINKFYDVEARIQTLLDILSKIELDYSLFSEESKNLMKKIFDSKNQEPESEPEIEEIEINNAN